MKRFLMTTLFVALLAAMVPVASAQGFTLTTPSGTTLIRDSSALTFTWTALAGATSYDLSVFKIGSNPRDTALGTVFTQNVSTGNCVSNVCTYLPTGGQASDIDRGQFAWTVVANTSGDDVEASNGPIFLSVNQDDIPLLVNSDFETGGNAPWTASNLSGDKVRPGLGKDASYGFQFKGSASEAAAIVQKVTTVLYYDIDQTDMLMLSMDYTATSAAVNGRLVAKVWYTESSGIAPQKYFLAASQHPIFFYDSELFAPAAPVRKIKVTLNHYTTGGKFTVDNAQLTLLGAP